MRPPLWKWLAQRFLGLGCKPQEFKPVILVTGCSSGIGLALATLLRRQKQYRVVATARPSSLGILQEQLPDTDRFHVRALDVLSPRQRNSLIHEIEEEWGPVNILINNAGVSYRSVLEHMDERDERRQIATNYLGPIGLIRRVLPKMRKMGRGKIINVSSVSGMLAMPTMASYSASKYALEGASEALWYECRPWGINVSLIQPGFIKSKSFERVCRPRRAERAETCHGAYSDYYESMAPFIERLMNMSRTTPDQLAEKILRVIQTQDPPLWIPATIDAWIFAGLRHIFPRRWLLPILFACLPDAKHWADTQTRRR